MPELPEVQTTVNGLHSKVLVRTFVDVWSDHKKVVKKPASFALFKKELCGKKIVRVWRRAKNVIFELSDGYSLLIHMKMTGHLLVGKWEKAKGEWVAIEEGVLREKINSYIHLILFLDNGDMIALSDVRKFAKVELVYTKELLKELEKLGPEPLEKDFTLAKFEKLFSARGGSAPGGKNKKGKVKEIIMRPEFIAGIGNIYASEALWWARIHPAKDVSSLNQKELKLLYTSIKKVLTLGIKFGGDSFSDYRDVAGEKGKFEGSKKVYQRVGETCYRCKSVIMRLVIAQRSAFYCPVCQKL